MQPHVVDVLWMMICAGVALENAKTNGTFISPGLDSYVLFSESQINPGVFGTTAVGMVRGAGKGMDRSVAGTIRIGVGSVGGDGGKVETFAGVCAHKDPANPKLKNAAVVEFIKSAEDSKSAEKLKNLFDA